MKQKGGTVLHDPRLQKQAVVILCVVVVLSLSLWFSASAVVPQLTLEWELSGTMQAWLTMSVQIGFVAGALTSAVFNLSDRISTPKVIAGGALLGSVFNAMIPLASEGPESALVFRFLTGAALAAVYPPGMKVMASWCRDNRGTCIGLLVGAVTIGSGMPHLLNALASDASGIPPWRQVLYGSSGQAMVASVLAAGWLRTGPYLGQAAAFHWKQAMAGLSNRRPLMANLGYFGHMWELYAMWAWVPIMLVESYRTAGWSPKAAGLLSFGIFLSGGVASFLAGKWADRVGRSRVTVVSLMTSAGCCVLAGLLFDYPLALSVLCLVWGFAVVADSAQFSAAVSELCDPRYVGTALQVQTSIGFLLTLVTLQLVPLIIDGAGFRWAFLILAPGAVLGAVAMVHLGRLQRVEGGAPTWTNPAQK